VDGYPGPAKVCEVGNCWEWATHVMVCGCTEYLHVNEHYYCAAHEWFTTKIHRCRACAVEQYEVRLCDEYVVARLGSTFREVRR
jgi:hypothetical protein